MLRACEEELDVGVLKVRFVTLRVALLRHILAHDRLHTVRQQGGAVVQGQTGGGDEVQRSVQDRRQAFVQADVLDMVVDHFVYRSSTTFQSTIPQRASRWAARRFW